MFPTEFGDRHSRARITKTTDIKTPPHKNAPKAVTKPLPTPPAPAAPPPPLTVPPDVNGGDEDSVLAHAHLIPPPATAPPTDGEIRLGQAKSFTKGLSSATVSDLLPPPLPPPPPLQPSSRPGKNVGTWKATRTLEKPRRFSATPEHTLTLGTSSSTATPRKSLLGNAGRQKPNLKLKRVSSRLHPDLDKITPKPLPPRPSVSAQETPSAVLQSANDVGEEKDAALKLVGVTVADDDKEDDSSDDEDDLPPGLDLSHLAQKSLQVAEEESDEEEVESDEDGFAPSHAAVEPVLTKRSSAMISPRFRSVTDVVSGVVSSEEDEDEVGKLIDEPVEPYLTDIQALSTVIFGGSDGDGDKVFSGVQQPVAEAVLTAAATKAEVVPTAAGTAATATAEVEAEPLAVAEAVNALASRTLPTEPAQVSQDAPDPEPVLSEPGPALTPEPATADAGIVAKTMTMSVRDRVRSLQRLKRRASLKAASDAATVSDGGANDDRHTDKKTQRVRAAAAQLARGIVSPRHKRRSGGGKAGGFVEPALFDAWTAVVEGKFSDGAPAWATGSYAPRSSSSSAKLVHMEGGGSSYTSLRNTLLSHPEQIVFAILRCQVIRVRCPTEVCVFVLFVGPDAPGRVRRGLAAAHAHQCKKSFPAVQFLHQASNEDDLDGEWLASKIQGFYKARQVVLSA